MNAEQGVIHTIEDLVWGQQNNPDLVKHYLDQVTVADDLRSYLRWLHDNQMTTDVVAKLRRDRKRRPGIHPSSASKQKACLLKLYYECTFEVEAEGGTYDEKMQITWDLGTLLHDTFQTWFSQMYGDQFEKEVELEDKVNHIPGHADGIFTFTNYRFILEMKSIKEGGTYGWDKVQAKPMIDHVRQSYFYMKLANVPFALIFYINKNAGEWIEHKVMFDQSVWDEIQQFVIDPVVAAAYGEGQMVEASPSWSCRWCHFKSGCPAKGGDKNAQDW